MNCFDKINNVQYLGAQKILQLTAVCNQDCLFCFPFGVPNSSSFLRMSSQSVTLPTTTSFLSKCNAFTNVVTLTSFTMQLYKNSEIVRKRTFSRVTSTSCHKSVLTYKPMSNCIKDESQFMWFISDKRGYNDGWSGKSR